MIDLHNDTLLELPETALLPYLRNAKACGITEIWLSVWTTQLPTPLKTIKAKAQILQRIANDPAYPICHLHIEDAWFLTPENLAAFIKLKPHSVGLTWNAANNLAGGAHSHRGITRWGYQVIRKLEAAGIQIDTAHLNRKSFYQLARCTTRPLVCTHTAFHSVRHHPRNLTDRQIQKIVNSGGLIGLCLVPKFLTKNTIYSGFHDIENHIWHYLRHFPQKHLCFGTDFFGTDKLPVGITNYRDLIHFHHATTIGKSVCGQDIVAYQFGDPNAPVRILVTGGMHAREHLTIHAVKELMHHYANNLPANVTIAFIPNCNPDGVLLATAGITPLLAKHAHRLQKINRGNADFRMWKANIRAVDLNVNYNAGWGQGATNITTPAPANYIGPRPHSEPETQAIVKFVQQFRPTVAIALHTKGEVIYYSRPEDHHTATKLAELTQYRAELSATSFGGLTDYLALRLGIPAFTIEIGNDKLRHPLGREHLPEVMSHIKDILAYFFTGA